MNILQYAEEVAAIIGNGAEARTVTKTNNVEYVGVMVDIGLEDIKPMFYLEDYFAAEKRPEEAAADIMDHQVNKVPPTDLISIKDVASHNQNYENVKDYIFLKLLKTEENDNPDMVSYPAAKWGFNDLSLYPRVTTSIKTTDGGGISSYAVSKKDFENWGVSIETVIEDGLRNPMSQPEINSLSSILLSMCAIGMDDINPEMPDLTVVSNKMNINGAVTIINAIDQLRERFGHFYVLPSSVHEVIIIPDSFGASPEDLLNIVTEVNEFVVSPVDRLSDNIYHF